VKVILFVIDTLRADHLSCYGYRRRTSPNIDRLADQGVLFSNAYPSDVPTQPSFTALLTGQRGINTGVVSHSTTENLSDAAPFLPQIIGSRGKGYATAAVSTLFIMKKWFARGFQWYMNPVAATPARIQQVDADEINDMAIPWIRDHADRDFFLFVHYWDPHTLYYPPEKYRRLYYKGDPCDPKNRSLEPAKKQRELWPHTYNFLRRIRPGEEDITDVEYVIAQYDGEITYADENVGGLMRALDEAGITEDTMVILTSDHGESLDDHHVYFDHPNVYEPTIHVPLIIRQPGRIPKRRRVDALVQLIDIPYTILETLDIPIPPQLEGRSLTPLLRGQGKEGYPEIYCSQGLWTAKRAIRTAEGWKLIKTIDPTFWETPETELFNLKRDPGETRNLADEETDIRDELELRMARWVEARLKKRPDPLRLIASIGLPCLKFVENAREQMKTAAPTAYEEWRRLIDTQGS